MVTPNSNATQSLYGGGPRLPPHDYEAFAYISTTNNVSTITGYVGGASGLAVGILTFTYVNAGASNDDNIASIALTLPTANG